MRAVIVHEFGGPDVLRIADLPIPVPLEGEVLVEVQYAGVNYADTLFRGNAVEHMPFSLPLVLGFEATGVVRKVGPGVEDFEPGERVLVSLLRYPRLGCYAEYVSVPVKALVRAPVNADLGDFLCLTHAVYSRQMLEAAVRPGDIVFVSAAAGGVGAYSMQLATRFGASRVIGGVGSPEKLALLQSRGYDAINYSESDWPQHLIALTEGVGPTLILSSIAGDFLRQSQRALAKGGRIIAYGFSGDNGEATINLPALGAGRQSILPNFAKLDNESRQLAYKELYQLRQTGQLPYIDKTILSYDKAVIAHRQIAERANIGKMLLKFPGTDG